MKPIPTYYHDHKFRSRLEARYAVYFDAIGLDWQYEVEGYVFESGECYLPDFYFPQLKCYGEVKPEKWIPIDELKKINAFGKEKDIIVLVGLPNNEPILHLSPNCNYEYVKFYNENGIWRFWASNLLQDETIGNYPEAIRKAKQAQFEFLANNSI